MSVLNSQGIPIDKVKFRWKEPYTSGSFNKAISGTLPTGIHHGFKIVPDGSNTTAVKLDYNNNVHDGSLAVINDDDNNRSFVYHEPDKLTYDLDPSDFRGIRVWIYLFVDYSIGSDTTAEVRLVDENEVGANWTNKAISLGSIRVPSTGDILTKHIEHGTAEIATLDSEWTHINHNSTFEKGVSGYRESGTSNSDFVNIQSSDVYSGNYSLTLGTGTTGTSGQGDISLSIPNMESDDLLHFRMNAKAKNFTSGTTFSVDIGNDYNVTLLDNDTSGFQEFGYTIDHSGSNYDEDIKLTVDIPSSSDTGEVVIDEFEVYTFRPSVNNHYIENIHNLSVRELDISDSDNNKPSENATIRSKNTGSEKTLELEDSITSADFADPNDGSSLDSTVSSLVGGANFGIRSSKPIDKIFRHAYFEGLEVQDAEDVGGSYGDLEVSSGAIRASHNSSGTASSELDLRYKEVSGATVSFDTTKNEIICYYNTDTKSIETDTPANVAALQDDVIPLAFVVNDTNVSAVLYIFSLKDLAQDIFQDVPLTVGPQGRFDNLHAPLIILEYVTENSGSGDWYSKTFDIEIIDGLTIDASRTETFQSPHHVHEIPNNVRIKGRGQKPVITISNWTDGDLFKVKGKSKVENVVFKPADLSSVPDASTGLSVFNNDSAIEEFVLEDVEFRSYTDSGNAETFGHVTNITGFESIQFRDCTFTGVSNSNTNRVVVLDDNGTNSIVKMSGVDWSPEKPDNCEGLLTLTQTGTNSIFLAENCLFGQDSTSSNSTEPININCSNKAKLKNISSKSWISIDGGEFEITNVDFDFSARSDAPENVLYVKNDTKLDLNNFRIEHTNAPSSTSERTINMDANAEAYITGGKIRVRDRTCIQMEGRCILQATEIVQSSGTPSSTSFAVKIDSILSNINGVTIENFPDTNAFEFLANADENLLSDIVVEQPSGGTAPSDAFTGSQANGLETDFLVVS